MKVTTYVQEDQNDLRLDHFLAQSTGDDISRTSIQKWIKGGHIERVSEPKTSNLKPNFRVKSGETFEITIPPKPKLNLSPRAMPLLDFWCWSIRVHGGPGYSFLHVDSEDNQYCTRRLDLPRAGNPDPCRRQTESRIESQCISAGQNAT